MKRSPHFLAVAAIVCAVLVFNACKKDDTKTCCNTDLPDLTWQLTMAQYSYHYGPGLNENDRHQFFYDKDGRLILYQHHNDLYNPARPPARKDTFYYDNQHRVSSIVSTDLLGGTYSYKKTFTYNSSGQRMLGLKYLLDNTNQYHLTDSIIYIYQDTTITKFIHHVAGGTDTAFFVYNHQQNLVKFNLGPYHPGIQTLSVYDNKINPFKYTGADALELDPYANSRWDVEFLLMAQMPQLSANNYQEKIESTDDYHFNLYYSPVDSLLSSASLSGKDFSYGIQYIYTPAGN